MREHVPCPEHAFDAPPGHSTSHPVPLQPNEHLQLPAESPDLMHTPCPLQLPPPWHVLLQSLPTQPSLQEHFAVSPSALHVPCPLQGLELPPGHVKVQFAPV